MSTPEPRSLAEIIGKGYPRWVIVSDGTNRASTHPPTKKPNGWHCPEPVTVDDMLAWLRKKLPEVEPHWNADGVASIHPHGDGWAVSWYCAAGAAETYGDTVHAAVEAAVRAVAEATSVGSAPEQRSQPPEVSSAVSDTREPGERK